MGQLVYVLRKRISVRSFGEKCIRRGVMRMAAMVATTELCHLADDPLLPELGLLVLVPLEEDAQGLEFEDGFASHLCFDVGKRLHLNSRHAGQPKLANDRAGCGCVDEQREHL